MITSLSAWEADATGAEAIRWSEVAPPVLAKQTIVSVELSAGDRAATGIASLTSYVDPEGPVHKGDLETSLSGWLGTAVAGVSGGPVRRANPYGPTQEPLRAVVELAVLDALGRETRLPASAFFGGPCRSTIQAYASLPSFARPHSTVECANAAVAAGFKAVKFHASGWVEEDLETIALARRELGPTIGLMWDASCAYELYGAVSIGRALTDADFLWFEAPLADDSMGGLLSLARHVSIPLVPDGLAQRPAADWARDIRDGVWGALRLDVTRSPEVSSALRLLRLSEALGVPCEIQSFGFPLGQYANLQVMLATQACRYFEAPFPFSDFEDGIATAPRVVDGIVSAPEGPGLGHEVGVDQLAERCRLLATLSL